MPLLKVCAAEGCLKLVPVGQRRCRAHRLSRSSQAYKAAAALTVQNAFRCWICGGQATADDPFTADHLIPLSKGGTHSADNLAAAHRSCNSRRGAKSIDEI